MVMYLFSTQITVSWRFTILLWGEIGYQHVKGGVDKTWAMAHGLAHGLPIFLIGK